MPRPSSTGDEPRLRQVVTNLLANARVHTPDGTSVVAVLERDGDDVVLSVEDDGPGIPPELVGSLFERFVRGDSSRSRRAGSTGLGTRDRAGRGRGAPRRRVGVERTGCDPIHRAAAAAPADGARPRDEEDIDLRADDEAPGSRRSVTGRAGEPGAAGAGERSVVGR